MIAVEEIPEEVLLAPARYCPGCDELWPDEPAFYADAPVCIACATERIERRRAQVREAARRYRAARPGLDTRVRQR